MSKIKLCPNGHYYEGDHCPYCSSEGSGEKITDGTVWTPINEKAGELREQLNVILKFDSAPDGIDRFVVINRKQGEMRVKSDVASMLSCKEEEIPKRIVDKITDIETDVDKALLRKNVYSFNDKGNALSGEYYLSEKTISSIIPDTLLTQILGESKLDVLYRETRNRHTMYEAHANTAALSSYGTEEFQNARKEIESKKYLSISFQDDSKRVLCIPERYGEIEIKTVEDFVSEDVSIFCPKIVVKEYGRPDIEYDVNAKEYAACLADIINSKDKSFYYKVSRQRVAQVLYTLVEKLAELHKKGLVHCDLKPQNILCLKDGLVPFDPINVKAGDVSAGMTTNYCAPEQILTRPVSPATDVYNMGLMVLSVIDAIVYGKTATYVIPTGGVGVREVRLLTDPKVYIDYESANIENKEGITHWKTFLEKCLAFEPEQRFQDMESFGNEYIQLLKNYPLKKDILFIPHFGRLAMVNQIGRFQAAWFINA